MSEPVHLHDTIARSRANGPGTRFVVWFQGCSLKCPGCFNPTTHAIRSGSPQTTIAALVAQIAATDGIEGVTVSGGEPFEQPEALAELCEAIRTNTTLSVVVFSGFTLEELKLRPGTAAIIGNIDVLIDGRYIATERHAAHLRGSLNQHIHLLTERYTRAEIEATPTAEVKVSATGEITITGVSPIFLPKL